MGLRFMLSPSLFIVANFVGKRIKVENLRFSSVRLKFRFLLPFFFRRRMHIRLSQKTKDFPQNLVAARALPTARGLCSNLA